MTTIYSAHFYCHGCGLENTFNFQGEDDYFGAAMKASTIACPSGCNPRNASFELTKLDEVGWEAVADVENAVFH